jgi:2-oxo-4-hydroxy-4-carboxy-5-ureidoimidazoline decarboxylase
MTLAELNGAERGRFIGAVGWVFEQSPWVAGRAWEYRPFASLDALHARMVAVVDTADEAAQLALLRAHPDLGARAKMSDASMGEQAGAGLDSLSPAEFERLQALNGAYRERFGFPFLFAVKGASRHDIVAALERRLSATREVELAEALRQVARIARFRLEDFIRT